MTATQVDETVGTWQEKLDLAREILGQGPAMLYRAGKLLIAVFGDEDWRRRIGSTDDFKLAEQLDGELADTGWCFLALRALIRHYPNVDQWGPGVNLVRMHEAMIAERSQATPNRPPRTRRSVTVEQYDTATAELDAEKRRTERLETELQSMRSASLAAESSDGAPQAEEPAQPRGPSPAETERDELRSENRILRGQLTAATKREARLQTQNSQLRAENKELQEQLCGMEPSAV